MGVAGGPGQADQGEGGRDGGGGEGGGGPGGEGRWPRPHEVGQGRWQGRALSLLSKRGGLSRRLQALFVAAEEPGCALFQPPKMALKTPVQIRALSSLGILCGSEDSLNDAGTLNGYFAMVLR